MCSRSTRIRSAWVRVMMAPDIALSRSRSTGPRSAPRRSVSLSLARERLASCRTRLEWTLERTLGTNAARLIARDARLRALSPLAVRERGYALVLDDAGAIVRSTGQIAPGDRLVTRLADGAFTSRVESNAAPQSGAKKPRRKRE